MTLNLCLIMKQGTNYEFINGKGTRNKTHKNHNNHYLLQTYTYKKILKSST